MHKGFFADTLARRPMLWQAMLQADQQPLRLIPADWDNALGHRADSLGAWLLRRPLHSLPPGTCPEDAEPSPFWDYDEESRRLALLDDAALAALGGMTGVALHAPEIAAVLLRDEVLALREALGEALYQYALYRGRYELGAVRRFFLWRDRGLPLPERCLLHGHMALRLVADLWPQALLRRALPHLPALPAQASLPDLAEEERHELWRSLKKLLLKEVAPSWAPCFS